MNETTILILAAGASTRMGQSKQLLPWKNKTLLTHAVDTAIQSSPFRVVVVLGADAQAHRQSLATLPIDIVTNETWRKGMGSSLKTGLRFIEERYPHLRGTVVMVCDQPFITSSHIQALAQRQAETKKEMVATRYAGILGVPAYFEKSVWPAIYQLGDEEGARKLLADNAEKTAFVSFEEAKVDLDTPADYINFTTPK
ncbi:MAG: nucleotidyltransferase family protein [Bacteroidota bacterium]